MESNHLKKSSCEKAFIVSSFGGGQPTSRSACSIRSGTFRSREPDIRARLPEPYCPQTSTPHQDLAERARPVRAPPAAGPGLPPHSLCGWPIVSSPIGACPADPKRGRNPLGAARSRWYATQYAALR
eukprot:scaffold85704_cov37-Tisochrysis_lutea.AAC.5